MHAWQIPALAQPVISDPQAPPYVPAGSSPHGEADYGIEGLTDDPSCKERGRMP
jgi:hypothetical protein